MFQINRFKNKEQIILAGLILFTLGIYVLRNGFLGFDIDWMSQHTVFPDYFRKLFYETGDLFPNFAANIGAGQNIYNFSYYGYLNPVILLSYLLPQVQMPVYIMITNLISLAAGCLLFYKWLETKGFSDFICVSVSFIFLLASPMLYHTYKQIMFVNYMPFLCLALIGVDRYFTTAKKGLLVISIFLMIMSSFYFSVSGLFAIILYWLSVHLARTEKLKARDFFRSGAQFLLPVFTAILMSGILLIPTFTSLLESHREGQAAAALYTLLIPEFNLLRYLYSPYGIGLPSIVITVLLAGLLYKNQSERVLAFGMVLITVFPIFLYVLNGSLYIGDKALIPFLPVICYLIALFFHKLEAKDDPLRKKHLILFLSTIVLSLISMGQTIYWIAAFADALLMFLCYLIYQKRNKIIFLVIPVIIILLITDIAIQNPDKLVAEDTYREIFNPDISKMTQELSDADTSFYRMDSLLNKDNNLNRIYTGDQYLTSFYSSSFQKDYLDFRNEVFQLEQPYRNYLMQPASQNPLFLSFMGVKYVRADYAPVGYELFMKKGNVKIYRNQNVFPLGYVTNKLISEKEFAKSEFPYRQELLLNHAVVKSKQKEGYHKYYKQEEDFQSKISPVNLSLPESGENGFTLASENGVYRVKAQADTYRYISLPKSAGEDQIVFLEMKVKNLSPLQDISIKIQNEQNKLSANDHVYYNNNIVFHYAVSVKKGSESLLVKFSKGEYALSSLQSYTLNSADMINKNFMDSSFEVSAKDTIGDVIAGSVNAQEDGYLITSIPYDENFKITMDGKSISCEEVNTAFIGFPISKGAHHIIFHYASPGFLPGAASSIIGFLILGFLIFADRKNRGDYCGE